MSSGELVRELERAGSIVSKRGLERLSLIAEYYRIQMGLLDSIDEEVKKSEELVGADVMVRAKQAKKAQRLAKKMDSSLKRVHALHEKGLLEDEEYNVFKTAFEKVFYGKIAEARDQLSKLSEMAEEYESFKRLREEAEAREKEASKRVKHLKGLLEQAASSEPVDEEYPEKHAEVKARLKELERVRKDFVEQLSSKTLSFYAGLLENKDLLEAGFPSADPSNLSAFLSDFPSFSSELPSRLLELDSWSDGKLGHTVPDTARFRELMVEYGAWLRRVERLESTEFIEVKAAGDAERLAPLFKETPAGELLQRLAELSDYWLPPPEPKQPVDTVKVEEELAEASAELALLQKTLSQPLG